MLTEYARATLRKAKAKLWFYFTVVASVRPLAPILPTIGAPPPYEEYARVIIEEGIKVARQDFAEHFHTLECGTDPHRPSTPQIGSQRL